MSIEKTVVQQALLDLRKRLGMTQQDLAFALMRSVITVCRWENTSPPSKNSLLQIAQYAREMRAIEIAETLERELCKTGTAPLPATPLAALKINWSNEKALEEACFSLRANREIPAVGREYLKALRAVSQAHALLIEQARKGAQTNNPWKYFQNVQDNLEEQLAYEKQRTKKKR